MQSSVVLRVGRVGGEAAACLLPGSLVVKSGERIVHDWPRSGECNGQLAAEVDAVRVMGIHGDGRVPVVPELHRVGVVGLDVGWRSSMQAVDVALRHRGHIRVAGIARHQIHRRS